MCKGMHNCACACVHAPKAAHPGIPWAHACLQVSVQYFCTDSGGPSVHSYYGNKEAIPSLRENLRFQK